MLFIYSLLILACLSLSVSFLLLKPRLATDVLADLAKDRDSAVPKNKVIGFSLNLIEQAKKEISFLRVCSAQDLRKEEKLLWQRIIFGASLGLSLGLIFFSTKLQLIFVVCIAGACSGYMVGQSNLRSRDQAFKQEIIFYLPVVMERIVMAVQAGLDIVPALKVIDEIEVLSRNKLSDKEFKVDAVTSLLRQIVSLNEAGLSFEAAVDEVSRLVDSHAIKHAFVHIALAQKEGGEIVFPLRELSEATQLYFQESVEEEIARMPIKATLPLLLTFAGLIVMFMTGPLIQVLNASKNPQFVSEKAK